MYLILHCRRYLRVDADKNFVESVDESGSVKHVSGVRETPEMKTGSAKQTAAQGAVLSTNGSTEGEVNAAASVEEFSIPRQLVQYYMNVTQKLRLPALCAFLRAHAGEKVVAFMSTCDAVDFHYDMFRRAVWPGGARPALSAPTAVGGKENGGSDDSQNKGTGDDENGKRKDSETSRAADSEFFGTGCRVKRLHGNVPQSERQATYRAFGASTSGVLICTDVAARGLDLPTVDWIVQYDPPAETADYVHRVGRTARKGERGHSLLFLLPRETAYLGVLEARGLRPKPLSLEGVLCAADAGKHDARRADEQVRAQDVKTYIFSECGGEGGRELYVRFSNSAPTSDWVGSFCVLIKNLLPLACFGVGPSEGECVPNDCCPPVDRYGWISLLVFIASASSDTVHA